MRTQPPAPRPWRLLPAAAVAALGTALLGVAPATAADPAPDFDAAWGGEPFYVEEQLATNGEGGFPNYRIPALAVTNDGDILASYDGRPTGADSPGPNSVLQRRSSDDGATWGEQTVVSQGETEAPIHGYSDPSYIVDRVTGDIFNFHVYSMDQGFGGSHPGTDPDDRNVIQANVARSTDGGHTWTERTITADITADVSWRSRFAASGQGIQLKYGEYAGRLIQQYTIINSDLGTYQALSVYSDDHGQTWEVGEPVGTAMDENKTVELSDGRVMLNSRDSAGSKFRKVAISIDGGETYGPVALDEELPDPTNNASIVRAFPNAEEGSAEAKVLLFSNAASQAARSNGIIRMSCDDGETWPISRVFQPGGMSYSTLATLPDGSVGLLYEPGNGIRFAKFNFAWLGGICAGLDVADANGPAGASAEVSVTVTSQMDALEGDLTLELPAGWQAGAAVPVSLTEGASATYTVSIDVPEGAYAGQYPITAVLTTDRGTATAETTFSVDPADDDLVTIVPSLRGTHEDYVRGDVLRYDYRVTNLTDGTISLVPAGDDLTGFTRPTAPNCGYQNLAAGASYTCTTAFHTVTEADLAAGEFSPSTTWSIHSGGYTGDVLETLERVGPTAQVPAMPGLIPQSQLSVAAVSSAQAGTPGEGALDGDPATTWHTRWDLTEGPHWITLDLGAEYEVGAVRYLGRQSGVNGMLREYDIYVSNDPDTRGEPVGHGELEQTTSPEVLEVTPTLGRYVTIEYVTSWSDVGSHFASAAEFNVAEYVPAVVDQVEPVDDVQVAFGASLAEAVAALAQTTTVTDDAGGTHEVSLQWTIDGFDGGQAGDYAAVGTFELPEGVVQADPPVSLQVVATVTVLPEDEGGSDGSDGSDGGSDASDGSDGGSDASDGGSDGSDGGSDAGSDAGSGPGSDAGSDTGSDAGSDAAGPGSDDNGGAAGNDDGADPTGASDDGTDATGTSIAGTDAAGAGSDEVIADVDDPVAQLPGTGANVTPLALGALLLLGAGVAVLARRREV